MNIVALISSLFMIIGTFLPWIQLGALLVNRGLDNPDGVLILIAAIISGSLATINLSRNSRKLPGIYFGVAIIGFAVCIIDYIEVQSRAQHASNALAGLNSMLGDSDNISADNFIGSGLYIVALGSIGLFLCGLGVIKHSSRKSNEEIIEERLNKVLNERFGHQLNSSGQKREEITNEIYTLKLNRIVELLKVQSKKIELGEETVELQGILRELITNREEAIEVTEDLKRLHKVDLIDNLKKVNNIDNAIKQNIALFIVLKLLEDTYPYNNTLLFNSR